ncbi:MAG TPA: hypothetical protein VMR98_05090 [Candidatus Polarisedimenticolaceae bacterium]|nr:hypothetical protein [Candidatus Polarisedimenticolaceae bacterium]
MTAGPEQFSPPLLASAFTVIVATIGEPVLLIAVKAGTLPVPPAARPMLVLLFVQVNNVPGTGPLIVVAALVAPLQTVWLARALIDGVGLTVIVNDTDGPVHVVPPVVKLPVTTIVATTAAVPVLVAMNDGILPAPTEASPIDGWLLVHV